MTQIDWFRAAFRGAIFGGLIWAVILRLSAIDGLGAAWHVRMLVIAVVVNAVVLGISWFRWRSATDERGRTRAAALWIVPFLGIAFVAAVLTIGIGLGALRGS